MRSLSFGRILGIRLELHWTFLVLAFFLVFSLALFDQAGLLPTITLFAFLFMSVFLHELSHSVVALSRGSKVSKIVLLPIGGIAFTESMPENPKDEFLISVAGPLFNFLVVFAILLLAGNSLIPFPPEFFSGTMDFAQIESAIFSYPLFALFWVNLILGAFNLFTPALPLDGGRVFRSILGIRLSHADATRFVGKLSLFFAGLFFVWGFLSGNIIILVISAFIYIGARQETRAVEFKETFRGTSIETAINNDPPLLYWFQSPREAFDLMLELNETSLLVVLPSGFGIISAESIEKNRKQIDGPLEKVCEPVQPVALETGQRQIIERVLSSPSPVLPVTENSQFIGSLSIDSVQKMFDLQKVKKRL